MPSSFEHAIHLRSLHVPGLPLMLANVWDVASARTVAAVPGSMAIATASWSVAAAHGYDDGEHVPLDEVLELVRRIVAAVDLPVTVDLEKGYGASLEDLGTTIRSLIATGAVGLNIEDSIDDDDGPLRSLDDAAARVRTVRQVAEESGVPLVINARTDALAAGMDVQEAIARGNAYLQAGADCIFLLGADRDTLPAAIEGLLGPVSVLARAGGMTVPELAGFGVARVSVGPGSMGVAYAALDAFARSLPTTERMPEGMAFRPGK